MIENNEKPAARKLFNNLQDLHYSPIFNLLVESAGLHPMNTPPGEYDYDKNNNLYKVGGEAILDVGEQLMEGGESVIFPNRIIEEVYTRGGIAKVVLDYSTKKLEQLTKEWDPEMFDEELGKGNTVYEKVIKALTE